MTYAQRLKALTDALLNTDSTALQQATVARTFAFADGAIAQYDDDNATGAERARLGIEGFRQVAIRHRRELHTHDRNVQLGAIPDAFSEFKDSQ